MSEKLEDAARAAGISEEMIAKVSWDPAPGAESTPFSTEQLEDAAAALAALEQRVQSALAESSPAPSAGGRR